MGKKMYAVKDCNGRYYVGYGGGWTHELCDAKIFRNVRDAIHIASLMHDFHPKIVTVELKEV